jgi:uncharacterized phage protein (TIGR01671 family)
MSREIKFRVWSKIRNKFTNFVNDLIGNDIYFTISIYGEIVAIDRYGDEIDINQNDFEIQQYTGLKDKNGKEIYEGDIINGEIWINDPNGKSGFAKITNRKIYFQSGTFMVDIRDYIHNVYKIEVVGNLYENPKLLEQ